jgi:hypothetical protein
MTHRRKLSLLLLVTATMILVCCIYLWQSTGSMTEFSPDLLAYRTSRFFVNESFCYYREQSTDSPLLTLIKQYKPKNTKESGEIRWCFVWGQKPNTIRWLGGPARRWHRRGYDPNVIKWSTENPELAKLLWPRVIELLQNEEYYVVEVLLRGLERIRSESLEGLIDTLKKERAR